MPIYEYKCPSCGLEKEVLQKEGEHAPLCPHCLDKEKTMIKQISKIGLRFKTKDEKNRI